jgi:hypothetical protein
VAGKVGTVQEPDNPPAARARVGAANLGETALGGIPELMGDNLKRGQVATPLVAIL